LHGCNWGSTPYGNTLNTQLVTFTPDFRMVEAWALPMTVRGQGIAWDRADPGVIFGVVRATPQERVAGVPNKVVAFRLAP